MNEYFVLALCIIIPLAAALALIGSQRLWEPLQPPQPPPAKQMAPMSGAEWNTADEIGYRFRIMKDRVLHGPLQQNERHRRVK